MECWTHVRKHRYVGVGSLTMAGGAVSSDSQGTAPKSWLMAAAAIGCRLPGRFQHSHGPGQGSAPGAKSGPKGQAEGRLRGSAQGCSLWRTLPSSPWGRGEAPPSQPGT